MENVSKEATNELVAGIMERQVRRMFVIIIVLIIGLIGTNVGWLLYESQFDVYTVTQETDGAGNVNVSGVTSGDIYYGEGEADN